MKIYLSTFLAFFFCSMSLSAQVKQQKNVYFELNDCETKDDLSQIVALFGDEGNIELKVFGYTDFLGSEHTNMRLSQCRAETVAEYLKEVLDERIIKLEVAGKGEIASPGETLEGEPKNRRVEIHYIVYQVEPEVIVPEVAVEPESSISDEEDVLKIDTSSNENIVLEGLQFIPGRHYPMPESGPILEKLLLTMQKNQRLEIEIQGFICCDYTVTDGFDNDTQEPKLSENRAKFVYTYLVKAGIDPNRIQYKGYGSTRPKVFPEVTPEDQQANRRVEIRILKY